MIISLKRVVNLQIHNDACEEDIICLQKNIDDLKKLYLAYQDQASKHGSILLDLPIRDPNSEELSTTGHTSSIFDGE